MSSKLKTRCNSAATILFFALVLISFNSKSQSFVKQDATGNNDGTSWQNAYTNLDSAISKTVAGDIWVAKGIYKPTYTFIAFKTYKAFKIDKNIALYGGFKGNEASLAQRDVNLNVTTLSGDIGVDGDNSDNTPRVIVITGNGRDSTTIIDGFTITKAQYRQGYDYDNAAVYINSYHGTPIIRNCTITENFGFSGAAIYAVNCSPLITNNNLIKNTAYTGAGIFCDGANPRIIGNRISHNQCIGGYSNLSGAAIRIGAYSSPYIYGNLIENNSANRGAGIYNDSNYPVVIEKNILSGNTATFAGGALYINANQTQLVNNLIVGNSAASYGGAIYIEYCGVNLVNNTIVNNSANQYGSALYLSDANMSNTNNIIYNNRSVYNKPIYIYVGRKDWLPKFEYNDIEDGINSIQITDASLLGGVWKSGNIINTPDFADTNNYNFQLNSQSKCIDAGRPDTASLGLPANDIATNNRIFNGIVDIGCYEFNSGIGTDQHFSVDRRIIDIKGWYDTSFNVNINTIANWSLENSTSWINPSPVKGTGNAQTSLTATKNPLLESSRIATLFLSNDKLNIPSIPILIKQGMGGYIIASPDTAYVTEANFNSTNFAISTNGTWYLLDRQAWLQPSVSSGTGNKSVFLSADSNFTGATRVNRINVANNYSNPVYYDSVVIVQGPTPSKICPGGSIRLLAGVFGSSYRWQVNDGNGYLNLSDNTNFIGSASNTMVISNIPSSWYGYQFRCMANGTVTGNIYTLQMSNRWIGYTNAWETGDNWSCGITPDENTDVVIFGGNVVISSNVVIRSLKVSPNASVTVTTGSTLKILQ